MRRKFCLVLKYLFLATLLAAHLATGMAAAQPRAVAAPGDFCDAHATRLENRDVPGGDPALRHCATAQPSCAGERCPGNSSTLSAQQSDAPPTGAASKRPLFHGETALRALMRADNPLRPPQA
ncbi:MAG: hypothetical protein H6901_01445 [Rhodobacteraceae bacterium]|nr:hypothetical protein [Paracoccaceae bacterium]MCP5340869.1 hypothetical protein [Paracoccaceae bacterium]